MIKKHKLYSRPRKPFDKVRIEDENKVRKEYGLKNKKEIWKSEAAVGRLRRRAKKLITAPLEEQEKLFGKLNKMGMGVSTITDVLALDKKNLIDRKLQSVVFRKKLAKTPKEARQLISHKKISINGQIVNQPSYLVDVNEENNVKLVEKVKKKPEIKEERQEEKIE